MTASIYVKKKKRWASLVFLVFLIWPIWGSQEDRESRKCLKAQETALKLFPWPDPTPSSPTSLTAPPPTATETFITACLSADAPPPVWIIYQQKCRNNLIEMKTHLLGIFFFFPCKDFSDPVGSRCHLLFCILKARWLQLSTISTINEFHRLVKSSKWDSFIISP